MAPRPRRTPRCENCVKRKIKCDYVKPTCGPCQRFKKVCVNAQNNLLFVSQNDRFSESTSDVGDKPESVGSPSSQPSPTPSHTSVTSIPSQTDLFSMVTAQYMPEDESNTLFSWLKAVPNARKNFTSLDDSAEAISILLYGRLQCNADFITIGTNLYSGALADNRAWELSLDSTIDTWHNALLNVLTLQLYQTIDFTPQTSWLQNDALAMMINNIGPQAMINPEYLSTFLFCRLSIISQCILSREALPNSAQWCLPPWGQTSGELWHKTMDALVLAPEYRESYMRLSFPPTAEEASIFFQQQNALDTSLTALLAEMEIDGPLYHMVAPFQGNERAPGCFSMFEYELGYNDLTACIAMANYWAGRLLEFEGKERLYLAQGDQLSPMYLVELTAAQEAAGNICRSAGFATDASHGLLGLHMMVMPMRQSFRFYKQTGMVAHEEWCKGFARGLMSRNVKLPELMVVD